MKVIAIIQARMGSTRLPGKVLMDLGGVTVLAHVLRRTCRATLIQGAMVATTESVADDAIVRECHRFGVPCFRGSEQDVLDRYYQAAHTCNAEAVVRVTSDCPLIDRELVDNTIRIFLDQRADYASNISPRTYPRGLDTEVFSMRALERAWREAREPWQREHVTPYLYVHPEFFRQASTSGQPDYSHYRWTLDTSEDLNLLRAIYARFDNQDVFTWREVIALMEDEPELRELNAHVTQKSSNS
jgi:spore coat polysaccharide biosynthesis protein SpsF (cytidylyltransferase family)